MNYASFRSCRISAVKCCEREDDVTHESQMPVFRDSSLRCRLTNVIQKKNNVFYIPVLFYRHTSS